MLFPFPFFAHYRSHLHCNLNLIEFSYFLLLLSFPQYSLVEPDGSRRTVDYVSRHFGFDLKLSLNLILMNYILDC